MITSVDSDKTLVDLRYSHAKHALLKETEA